MLKGISAKCAAPKASSTIRGTLAAARNALPNVPVAAKSNQNALAPKIEQFSAN